LLQPRIIRIENNMAFVKADPRINRKGAPKKDRSVVKTRREVFDGELVSLLRKLKPHIADSVKVAARIMKRPDANDMTTLRAVALIQNLYKDVLKEAYGYEDKEGEESEIEEIQQSATVFSLKMINTPEDNKPEE
jgi:hypothetical protein